MLRGLWTSYKVFQPCSIFKIGDTFSPTLLSCGRYSSKDESTTDTLDKNKTDDSSEPEASSNDKKGKGGWLRGIFSHGIKMEGHSNPQSGFLSDQDNVFEMQLHSIWPEHMATYLDLYGHFCKQLQEVDDNAKLIASWTTEIGEQDTAIHLWQYPGGYLALNRHYEFYRTNPMFSEFRRERNKLLRHRSSQILLPFNFWPPLQPDASGKKHIYELRTYTLKAGTMIEWGNYWARGIRYRLQDEEAFLGLFSHIGNIHQVHHIWKYDDLERRKIVRDAAWRVPGWDECVLHTVPLIRYMQSSIIIPTPFSPHQ